MPTYSQLSMQATFFVSVNMEGDVMKHEAKERWSNCILWNSLNAIFTRDPYQLSSSFSPLVCENMEGILHYSLPWCIIHTLRQLKAVSLRKPYLCGNVIQTPMRSMDCPPNYCQYVLCQFVWWPVWQLVNSEELPIWQWRCDIVPVTLEAYLTTKNWMSLGIWSSTQAWNQSTRSNWCRESICWHASDTEVDNLVNIGNWSK